MTPSLEKSAEPAPRVKSARRALLTSTGGVTLLLGVVSVLVAACGGEAPPGVVSQSSTTTSSPAAAGQSGALYASCMRAHGVSNFPDSGVSVNDGQVVFNLPASIKSEAQFPSASRACSRDLPGGGASAKPSVNISGDLKFAQCMRAHGISNFPDPMPGGGFDIRGNTDSPRYRSANQACQSDLRSSES
jgi:hypothetical protein